MVDVQEKKGERDVPRSGVYINVVDSHAHVIGDSSVTSVIGSGGGASPRLVLPDDVNVIRARLVKSFGESWLALTLLPMLHLNRGFPGCVL